MSAAARWQLPNRRVWHIEDGLPHDYVTAIATDSKASIRSGRAQQAGSGQSHRESHHVAAGGEDLLTDSEYNRPRLCYTSFQ